MRNLTGIAVLAVLAGIVPACACGANLLRSDWAGRELHLVDRDAGASNSNLYWRVPNAVLKDVHGDVSGRTNQVHDGQGVNYV